MVETNKIFVIRQENKIDLNKKFELKRKNLKKKLAKETISPIVTWTTHGLPNIFRTKYISLKIIWSILFLLSVGWTIYFLINTILDYLKYNVTTVTRNINVNEMNLPVVTICEKNRISTVDGLNFLKYLVAKEGYNYETVIKSSINNKSFSNFITDFLYSSELFYELPIMQRRNLTKPIEEMLVSVKLNEIILNKNEFKWIFHPIIGNCYQFNIDSKFKATDDNGFALSIKLNLSQPKELDIFEQYNYVIVRISDQNANPFLFYSDIILGYVGYETQIKLEKSVFKKYPKPYSDCDFVTNEENDQYPIKYDRKYYDQIINAGYSYSQSMCISFCQLDRLGNNCTLRISSINAPNNIEIFCPNINLSVFDPTYPIYVLYKDFFQNGQVDENECLKKCPLECNTIKYHAISQAFPYPQPGGRNDSLKIKLYYSELSYLNYEETPTMIIYNLISNLGGIMGFMLGNYTFYEIYII